jgi:hypothetical protein
MQASCIDPSMSAYEAFQGLYNWNHFPLATLGCKAIIYKYPDTQGSWGSRGMDAWYLGPLVDHYKCNHYFVPEMRAYQISGSVKLFPQHCQVPFLSAKDHLQELMNKVVSTMTADKQQRVLTLFHAKLSDEMICPNGPAFLTNPCHAWILPEEDYQREPQTAAPTQDQQRMVPSKQQRVSPTPEMISIEDLCQMSNAPPIMNAPNPTTKRALKLTKWVHC